VIRALVLVAFPSGLRFEFLWVQIIPWGQSVGEIRVLFDPCGGGSLHGSEVHPTGMGTRIGPVLDGFFVIKKKLISSSQIPSNKTFFRFPTSQKNSSFHFLKSNHKAFRLQANT